ncbi:MAG: NAD(P)H-dependent oxidoreductase [Phenylobacterium sp.]|nr:NAD(P)H-dependent oxidoreductase [Phenylobacterium sp.]
MKVLLIVHHSRTGGARQMAEAAAASARDTGDVEVRFLEAPSATAVDVLEAHGYLFVCPENLAAITGEMKAFFDQTYYPVLGKIEGRPYALMVCAGSDGENAVRQMARIATGWRLRPVADPIIVCTHAQTPEAILAEKQIGAADLARCGELGAALAAGLAMGIY